MHRHPGPDDPVAASPPARRPNDLGPTALDRLLVRAQRAAPVLTRATDLVLVVVTVVLLLADAVVWATDPVVDEGRLSFSLAVLVPVVGAVAVVAVALRTRRLAAAVGLLVAVGVSLTVAAWAIDSSLPPSLAALFALALLAVRALRHERGRTAVLLTAVTALGVAAEAIRPQVAAAGYLLAVCTTAFAMAVGVGVYLRWSDWRRQAAADAARLDERLEIARELHDVVGHHLTGMVVQAQAARHVAADRPTVALDALARIEDAGRDALAAMRGMVGALRDDAPTTTSGTWDDVDRLLAAAADRGQPVRASVDPAVRDQAGALAPSVHRILVESLTNVRRHGRSVTRVDVDVRPTAGSLVVTVRDDGAAAPPTATATGQFGVLGMRERATALGGSLDAGPDDDGGWLVRAELPLAADR